MVGRKVAMHASRNNATRHDGDAVQKRSEYEGGRKKEGRKEENDEVIALRDLKAKTSLSVPPEKSAEESAFHRLCRLMQDALFPGAVVCIVAGVSPFAVSPRNLSIPSVYPLCLFHSITYGCTYRCGAAVDRSPASDAGVNIECCIRSHADEVRRPDRHRCATLCVEQDSITQCCCIFQFRKISLAEH